MKETTFEKAQSLCSTLAFRLRKAHFTKKPCIIHGPTGGYIVTTHGWAEDNGFDVIAW